jgi:hypothetical protein
MVWRYHKTCVAYLCKDDGQYVTLMCMEENNDRFIQENPFFLDYSIQRRTELTCEDRPG